MEVVYADPQNDRTTMNMNDPLTSLSKTFTFEAAHRLPNLPPTHKCSRLHGHSYRVTLHVEGVIDSSTGFVIDFSELSIVWKPLHAILDHYYLNDISGLENPTSENLARWIWDKIKPDLSILCAVKVEETCTSSCTYVGPDQVD